MEQWEFEQVESACRSDEPRAERVLTGDGWAVVRLGSGERRNALSLSDWQEITSTFHKWATQDGPRAVVLRGNGRSAFSAGADIAEFPKLRIGLNRAAAYNATISDAINSVAAYPWPVVAMINGIAVGGGCELAAACDVRIASGAAVMGLPISKLGVILGVTETQSLLRLVGPAKLKWLIFSGELIGAEEARRIGLVESLVDESNLSRSTAQFVSAVLGGSPETIRASKYVTDLCSRSSVSRDVEQLIPMAVAAYESDGYQQRVLEFLKRRSGDR
ncbi:MAG: enoyl-CoA hydratase/isomerase family protein [Actinomycetota bacterium]|jgi:enoyl-CoA hydratase|nr:enoyl-CoA hydratase/isomerase family protein [Actinomycetota bacterium]